MELRLNPVTAPLTSRPAGLARTAAAGVPETGFAGALSGALKAVSAAQGDATTLQREVQMENPNVSLEQTMVALQKAQIGFQATLHVRNRMVQAYTDIMNMQV
ncbi:MAG: flagellar hook-basal body complex protein FliE [Comamonadaceae bacterium]|nr:MAG: flagellar hook-basal body complex protein FliE [Comamonadaceae bacterium]